jgi:hypothetical protein
MMKSDKMSVSILQGYVRQRGAMDKLITIVQRTLSSFGQDLREQMGRLTESDSKTVAARTATDEIVDLRLKLPYLSVPIHDNRSMSGDNKAVVDSSVVPNVKLHKRHNTLSFHSVCEAVCSSMVCVLRIGVVSSSADIFSNHWNHVQVRPLLKSLSFPRDPTMQDIWYLTTLTDERGVTSLESE